MTAEYSADVPQSANPLGGELARSNRAGAVLRGKSPVRAPLGEPASQLKEFVHDSFRALVLNPAFSCVGAKSAIRRGSYRLCLYAEMGSSGTTVGLARDLSDFVEERDNLHGDFSTFVACFEEPVGIDEEGFEGLLWAQLQRLHEQDRHHHRWDPSVSPDPEDPNFAFSFAGSAFFVVGLHAASSRFTRRFAWPTLVFNAHHQFDKLRADGRYDRFQEVIRNRERDLQGSLNPNLADFGTSSEARQYSGRPVEKGWRCPFQGPRADDPHHDARAFGDHGED